MKEKIRKGYTTGSCCAAGAAAALCFILADEKIERWNMIGPTGLDISVPINKVKSFDEHRATAVVIKDGGDDPDVTTGAEVVTTVSLVQDFNCSLDLDVLEDHGYFLDNRVYLSTGRGIGLVTKPGLACPMGKAAVNPVPRQMILKEIVKVCEMYSYEGKVWVDISIPKGIELAEKTFNPKLGIEGGISVLGTTGVVHPMSSQAILDTVKVELSVAKALREKEFNRNIYRNKVIITPGNYGLEFLGKAQFNLEFLRKIPEDNVIKASNFIGDSVVLAAEAGFNHIIVSGHLGKMIKVAGGMLNTHSKYGDNRIETAIEIIEELYEKATEESTEILLAEKNKLVEKVSEAVMVDEILRLVLEFCGERGLVKFSQLVGEKVRKVLQDNLGKVDEKYDKIKVSVIIFTNKFGMLYADQIV